MKIIITIILALSCLVPASAQQTTTFPVYVNSLAANGTPSGSEYIYVLNGSTSKKLLVGSVVGSSTSGNLASINSSGQVIDSSNNANSYATLPKQLYLNIGSFTPNTTGGTLGALGVYVSETPTGTCGGGCAFNFMNIAADSAVVGSGSSGTFVNGNGWLFNHNVSSASVTGNRITADFNMLINHQTGNTAAGVSYSAAAAIVTATANDNGSGTGASNTRGQVEAFLAKGVLNCGTCYWSYLQAAEFDVSVIGTSYVYNKEGIAIIQLATDAVQGANIDTAILIGTQGGTAPGWKNGILFGAGHWPFASTAVAMTCSACGTLDTFIDMSGATITTNFLKSPNFLVSGIGAVTAAAYSVGATAGVDCPSGVTAGTVTVAKGIVTHC